MSTHLEDQLAAAMREHTAGIRLTSDIVAAAARRHRRRAAIRRAASAVGTLALAGAVAVVLPTLQRPTAPERHHRASGPATTREPAVQTVAYVSARVRATLADDQNQIEQVSINVRQGKRTTYRGEFWYDQATRTERHTSAATPGAAPQDWGATRRGSRSVMTTVDYKHRVWWTATAPGDPAADERGLPPSTPAAIRASLKDGSHTFTIVGREQVDGRATLHLRLSDRFAASPGSQDLWVDAATYQVVRRVTLKPVPDGVLRVQEDFQWLQRTPQALAKLEVVPPPGFTRVSDPVSVPPREQSR